VDDARLGRCRWTGDPNPDTSKTRTGIIHWCKLVLPTRLQDPSGRKEDWQELPRPAKPNSDDNAWATCSAKPRCRPGAANGLRPALTVNCPAVVHTPSTITHSVRRKPGHRRRNWHTAWRAWTSDCGEFGFVYPSSTTFGDHAHCIMHFRVRPVVAYD
jgi:hypothetical protein